MNLLAEPPLSLRCREGISPTSNKETNKSVQIYVIIAITILDE
jgi:hypothetical protein